MVLFLCLGGRSHEAYCNRVVCLSVVLSVCYTIFAAHAGRYALKLANAGRNRYYLGCELAKVPCKALF